MVQAPWSTTVDDWIVVENRPVPGMAAAIWGLPTGPFRYAEGRFDPDSIALDAVVLQLVAP
jgi:hypothetical protein